MKSSLEVGKNLRALSSTGLWVVDLRYSGFLGDYNLGLLKHSPLTNNDHDLRILSLLSFSAARQKTFNKHRKLLPVTMGLRISFRRYRPTLPTKLYLTTPLYIATLFLGLAGLLLLMFSGDGFYPPGDHSWSESDDLFLFPINTLFISAMTPSVRCFLWLQSWWVQVHWAHTTASGDDEGKIRLDDEAGTQDVMRSMPRLQVHWAQTEASGDDEGKIRLYDEADTQDGMTPMSRLHCIRQILLSWNALLAATLTASLGVLLWRLCENGKGRILNPEAGFGTLVLAIDW